MLVVLSSSGCAWFAPKPPKPPKEMLITGLTNYIAQRSADFSIDMDINALGKDVEEKPQNMRFDLNYSGESQMGTDGKAEAFNSVLVADVAINKDHYKASAELRSSKEFIYAVLNSLTGAEKELPKEQLDQIAGKWWKIPLPKDLTSLPAADPVTVLASLKKNLAESDAYIKEIQYEGTDMIKGLDSYHYEVVLDREKLRALVDDYAVKQEMSAEDKQDLQKTLAGSALHLEFWVSRDALIFDGFKARFKVDTIIGSDRKSAGRGDGEMMLTLSNFGKSVKLNEPKESQTFDLFGLLGSFGVLPQMDLETELPVDGAVKKP